MKSENLFCPTCGKLLAVYEPLNIVRLIQCSVCNTCVNIPMSSIFNNGIIHEKK